MVHDILIDGVLDQYCLDLWLFSVVVAEEDLSLVLLAEMFLGNGRVVYLRDDHEPIQM